MTVIDDFRGRWHDLSNFGPSPVTLFSTLEGREITFPSGEHAFNWAKSLDPVERAWVLAADSPAEAKKRGRQVTLRGGWDDVIRYAAMRWVVWEKFRADTPAGRLLLETGDALLVEGNTWHDQVWGDCRCGRAKRCAPSGRNRLGLLLMERRIELGGRRPCQRWIPGY